MKKYLIGFVTGVLLTAAGTAYADDIVETLVGKQIQGETKVTVNGNQLTQAAAIVDGTSYLPVRAVADSLNLDVSYDQTTGVQLKEKGAAVVTDQSTQQISAPVNSISPSDIQNKIDYFNDQIKIANWNISALEDNLKNNPSDQDEQFKKTIDELKAKITDYKKQITDLEAQQ